jgi:hypothetical protein
MKYAKLEDGVLRFAPKVLRADGKTMINPNADTLKTHGYLPIAEDIMPIAMEGCEVQSAGYAVEDGQIVHKWVQVAKPVPTDEAISALRAQAYRDRVDPITCEVQRLRDMGGTHDEIVDAMARRDAEVAKIKAEYPYAEGCQ